MRKIVVVGALTFAACGGDTGTTVAPTTEGVDVVDTDAAPTVVESTQPTTTAGDGGAGSPDESEVDMLDAIAVNVATNGVDPVAVTWTSNDGVWVARLDASTGELQDLHDLSGDITPIGHPIERPAISIGADGVVHVAFTSFVGNAGTVYVADLVDGEATEPRLISGEPRLETNLVHMSAADEQPIITWLEESTLSVAMPTDDGPVEIENVDDLTCDCCNPVPLRLGDDTVVAYRNLERDGDTVIRDVVSIVTPDDGASFTEPVLIADDHWFIDACPFSGPAVVDVDGDVVVTWMDGRQSVHPDQDGTTIWVDRSTDGGASYGPDQALTETGINRWPVIAVDDSGTLHLVWEVQAGDGGISYSSSTDGGVTFSAPTLLIPNDDTSGLRKSPSVVAHGDEVIVTWVDRTGGHLRRFATDEMPTS